MFDVACLGILVADVVTRTVQGLPDSGKLTLMDHIDLYTGGCAVSSAVDMARLGLKTAISGKLGDDGFGRFMRQALEADGVDASHVAMDGACATSASVVLVDAKGERSFLHCLGANGTFTDTDVPDTLLADARIVFVAGTMLMPAFDGEPCARVLERARNLGARTALDTAWDAQGRWMKVLSPCLPHLDYFLPSYDEAVALSGETDPDRMADLFLEKGVGTVVIKLGADGCLVSTREQRWRIPGFPVSRVLDTTGAGDAFCAGFLTGITKGLSLQDAGRMGNAVGSLCIGAVGASTGIHSYEQVLARMKGE
jgi:sugar/nucleoside kinase (ribokinase family)